MAYNGRRQRKSAVRAFPVLFEGYLRVFGLEWIYRRKEGKIKAKV